MRNVSEPYFRLCIVGYLISILVTISTIESMDDTKEKDPIIDLLMQEFHERRNEMMFHIGLYHKQIAYSYIYISIIATLGGVIDAFGSSQQNRILLGIIFSKGILLFSIIVNVLETYTCITFGYTTTILDLWM